MSTEVQLETERIDLGNGDWWEIRGFLTRGMRKAVDAVAFKVIDIKGLRNGNSAEMDSREALMEKAFEHPEMAIGFKAAQEDAYLIHGSIAWSFPEELGVSAFDLRRDSHVDTVLARMNELYDSPSEDEAKN